MPRGSKLGERRGGRQRGTPNRRTVLADRILAIASARPTTSGLTTRPGIREQNRPSAASIARFSGYWTSVYGG